MRISRPVLRMTHLGLWALFAVACGSDAPADRTGGASGASSFSDAGGSPSVAAESGDNSSQNGAGMAGSSNDITGSSGDSTPGSSAGNEEPSAYANVTRVTASGSSGSYTFDVSVESSDIDCSQFADWWEVLDEDGALLYRRILEHSHTDENGTSDPDAPGNTFTRSGGPIAITEAMLVIVRAHLSNAGYAGQVMKGSVASGFEFAPEIGPDFAAAVEHEDPQPTTCEF